MRQLKYIIRLLKLIFCSRKVELVRYPKPMAGEELRRAFQSLGAGNPFWQALDTVIDSMLLDFMADVADPKIVKSPELLAQAAGRVDAIATVKSTIEEFKSDDTRRISELGGAPPQ